jgi:hypothetical protein
MPKSREFIAFAEQCEQLAKRLPEHAKALQDIAAAWRQLAEEAEKREDESSVNAN